MIDFIQEWMLDVSDRALRGLIESGNALRIKNDEEACGHLIRCMSAVRSEAEGVKRAMKKALGAMISGEDFWSKVNTVYIAAQSLSAEAMQMGLCARQICEQNAIWPYARAGVLPLVAMAEEVKDEKREAAEVQDL